MAYDVNKVRLGGGDLYLNGVQVGYLSGDVVLSYSRERATFSPSGSGSQNLISIGRASLKASLAEFKADNLRLALGRTGSAATSVGAASYNPASFSFDASTSWQGVTVGGESLSTATMPLLFQHTKEDGKKVALILYSAASTCQLKLPFGDKSVTTYDIEFVGIPDETRPHGDQVGMLLEEI